MRRALGDLPRGHGVLGSLIRDPKPLRLRSVGDHPQWYVELLAWSSDSSLQPGSATGRSKLRRRDCPVLTPPFIIEKVKRPDWKTPNPDLVLLDIDRNEGAPNARPRISH